MSCTRRTLLRAAGAVALLPAPRVQASTPGWPSRTITIVVPYSPGGGTDIFTRAIADGMRRSLGQNVIVDNRPGANGVIGAGQVARSEPDGHTLTVVTGAHVINRYTMLDMPFHPVRDFAPVALLSSFPLVLAASGRSAFHDIAGLLAAARARPGTISFSSTEAATSYVGNSFARQAGIQLNEVSYRGSGPQMNDLIAGHIDLAVTSTVAVLAHVGTGRVRVLGVTSSTRAASMPDVPTIQEAGLPGFEFTGHYAMYAPPAVSAEIRERLYRAVREAMAVPETAHRLRTLGADLTALGPREFASFLEIEDARWARAAAEGLITSAR